MFIQGTRIIMLYSIGHIFLYKEQELEILKIWNKKKTIIIPLNEVAFL